MPLINHNNAVIIHNTIENIVGTRNAQIIANNDNVIMINIMIKTTLSPLLHLHIQISYNFSTIDFLTTFNVFL
jgi:hypothetical protein